VVFIGPYEHHSNELPWRESIADVVTIDEDRDGRIDLDHLVRELENHRGRPLKIGSFSAASNVTGIVSDTDEISRLLHRHGALAFWDYAAAAPYVNIAMNPSDDGETDLEAAKDAVFISPHKFIGGPGTPGVLVVKRHLLTNLVPTVPGGGTVSYVSAEGHSYVDDPTVREEGGTPAIIESIRAGLVFLLKSAVGEDTIEALEASFVERAIASWSSNPRIEILGNRTAPRLSIVSFLVRRGDRFLHHNFVVALLNDLFGIQVRGGCSCAGPYGHRLLRIDGTTSSRFRSAIHGGCEGIKPGWVRIGFNYFISERVFEFLLDAVHMVADHGWKLLPEYDFEPTSGVWRHRETPEGALRSLLDVDYRSGVMDSEDDPLIEPESALPGYLAQARELLEGSARGERTDQQPVHLSDDLEALRWFPLSGDTA
jgi:selenocysteine lyase/cysteine desulfurase